MQIADALRLLRTRQGLTQTAASRLEGAPDFRTLSHWETRRKLPSLKLLGRYLDSQDYDFHDLQDALDQVNGVMPKRLKNVLKGVERRLESVEWRLQLLEGGHFPPAAYQTTVAQETRPTTAAQGDESATSDGADR